jgi:hypothetical protein
MTWTRDARHASTRIDRVLMQRLGVRHQWSVVGLRGSAFLPLLELELDLELELWHTFCRQVPTTDHRPPAH